MFPGEQIALKATPAFRISPLAQKKMQYAKPSARVKMASGSSEQKDNLRY
jgi:hypothetical protein